MKKLLAATGIALLMTTPVYAAETAEKAPANNAGQMDKESAAKDNAQMPKDENAQMNNDNDAQMAEESTTEMKADRQKLAAPQIEREGYSTAVADELTKERLVGARVYGSNDEDVGEVDQVITNDSGKITEVVLDIGGFLGLGEHSIAVTMEEVRVVQKPDDSDLRVYIDGTEETLKAQPEYTKQ